MFGPNGLLRGEGRALLGTLRCWRQDQTTSSCLEEGKTQKLLLSCSVQDPHVEPNCVPARQHPHSCLLVFLGKTVLLHLS